MRRTKTTVQFIMDARTVHGDRYSYEQCQYVNVHTEVTLICHQHGPFIVPAGRHLQGRGCKVCGSIQQQAAVSKGTEKFVKDAIFVHGHRYDYHLVAYENNYTHVTILCPTHGQFTQTPANHLAGRGCRKCGERSASDKKRMTVKGFTSAANAAHGNKYHYHIFTPIHLKDNISIQCLTHGVFTQKAQQHINGSGCPKCAIDILRSNKEIFVSRSRNVHGDIYDYSKSDYRTAHTKVVVGCPIHGEFLITPHNHLYKRGCPRCKRSSRGEKMIHRYLSDVGVTYQVQASFSWCDTKQNGKPLRYDFYIPDWNLLIEFDGRQHFEPVALYGGDEALKKTQERDRLKDQLARDNGIALLRIPYTEEENIETMLKLRARIYGDTTPNINDEDMQ